MLHAQILESHLIELGFLLLDGELSLEHRLIPQQLLFAPFANIVVLDSCALDRRLYSTSLAALVGLAERSRSSPGAS
jgi:hypothetical protein